MDERLDDVSKRMDRAESDHVLVKCMVDRVGAALEDLRSVVDPSFNPHPTLTYNPNTIGLERTSVT